MTTKTQAVGDIVEVRGFGRCRITWKGIVGIYARPMNDTTKDPAKHCFREDSPTKYCRSCGRLAEEHTGCDCEDYEDFRN